MHRGSAGEGPTSREPASSRRTHRRPGATEPTRREWPGTGSGRKNLVATAPAGRQRRTGAHRRRSHRPAPPRLGLAAPSTEVRRPKAREVRRVLAQEDRRDPVRRGLQALGRVDRWAPRRSDPTAPTSRRPRVHATPVHRHRHRRTGLRPVACLVARSGRPGCRGRQARQVRAAGTERVGQVRPARQVRAWVARQEARRCWVARRVRVASPVRAVREDRSASRAR